MKHKLRITPYALILPCILLLGVGIAVPAFDSILTGFSSFNLLASTERTWNGLGNFRKLFTDQSFQNATRFTLGFIALSLSIEVLLGLVAASLVSGLSRITRNIVSTIFFIPYMLAPLTVGLMWKLLFSYDGAINALLGLVGFGPVSWLGDPNAAFAATIIAEIWRSYPFGFIMCLSAIMAMPIEPFEAATVDGASALQRFRYITLPLLRPTLTIVLIYQLVLKLRVFDLVYILTGGGPVDYTMPLGFIIYRYYFRYYEAGMGSATAIFVLLISIVVTAIVIRNVYVEYKE